MKNPTRKNLFILPLVLFVSFVTIFTPAYAAESTQNSLEDHQAQIFSVQGDVKILKANELEWSDVQKGMVINVGDQLLTAQNSHVEIAYDDFFLNIARIDASTKAEFISIEPTDLRLEDGTIFSALDGLKGSSYQVTTPTAVAAVRGTHFDVTFDAATQTMEAAVIPDQAAHISALEITTLAPEGGTAESMMIQEGQQIGMQDGALAAPEAVAPERIEQAGAMLDGMMQGVDPSMRKMGETLLSSLEAPAEPAQEQPDQENQDPENAETADVDPPANEPEMQAEDDEKKIPGGGNGGDMGGGNPEGGEGPADMTGMMSRTEGVLQQAPEAEAAGETDKASDAMVDSFADSLIPNEAVNADLEAPSQEGVRPDGIQNQDRNTQSGTSVPAPGGMRRRNENPEFGNTQGVENNSRTGPSGAVQNSIAPEASGTGRGESSPRYDSSAMMQFLQAGGVLNARSAANSPSQPMVAGATAPETNLSAVFTNLGYAGDKANQMADGFNRMVGDMNPQTVPGGPNMAPTFAAPAGVPLGEAVGTTPLTQPGAFDQGKMDLKPELMKSDFVQTMPPMTAPMMNDFLQAPNQMDMMFTPTMTDMLPQIQDLVNPQDLLPTNTYTPDPAQLVDFLNLYLNQDPSFYVKILELLNRPSDPNDMTSTPFLIAAMDPSYDFGTLSPLLYAPIPETPNTLLKITDVNYVDGTDVEVEYQIAAGDPLNPSQIIKSDTLVCEYGICTPSGT